MNIVICAVGKEKEDAYCALYQRFVKRMPWNITCKEIEVKKPLCSHQKKCLEGQLLLQASPPSSFLILLDEKGKEITSMDFAKLIGHWQNQGHSMLSFLIGGAEGHGPHIREKSHYSLSFGKMTWPHKLIRVMLAEQLYRAYSLLHMHPYHKE